ncbi:MAG: PQQ-dependent sugar dehydrogenase [Acidobacteriota bacterium]
MKRLAPFALAALLGAVGLGFSFPSSAALPAGFIDELVTAATSPTAIVFTPDGRLLITRQQGELIVRQGTTNTSAVTFPTSQLCSNFERGLLGVAVDPNFGSSAGQNHFIYLFYSFHKMPALACTSAGSSVNRVSRFVLADTNTVDLATELILIDNMPSTAGNHNAGDVQFGKDGYLYVTIGDGGADYAGGGSAGTNDAARDEFELTGKVLRITKDGGIPVDNPFQGAGTARCNVTGGTTAGNKCQETYSWGHRNPFRIAFDPNVAGTRFFINDVGQDVREEFDLGTAGADFGWNCREGTRVNNTGGTCNPTPPNMVPPIFEYSHGVQVPGSTSGTSCNSITGGAFVPNGIWPATYDNSYLFSDYVCGWIFRVAGANTNGPFTTTSDFATNLGGSSAVALRFGPYLTTQALYYTTFSGGGQVRRVRYSAAGNNPPTASFTATPLGGPAPLMVNFDGSASSDPDAGNTLTYFWTFGDGTPETSTTTATTSHSYAANGNYVASLRVRDNNFAFSPSVTHTIQVGNTPPMVSIASPTSDDRFFVGQTITLVGFATDAEEGPIPFGSVVWTVRLHHNEHTHPLLGPVSGSNVQFVAPAPENVPALDTSFVEIDASYTDSGGLTGTAHLDFQPNRVATTFATSPVGLSTTVNGTTLSGPTTILSWQAWTLNVDAPSPQILGATNYGFTSWSDGGAQSHTIVTPASVTTFTANFTALPPPPLNYFTVTPCRLVDTRNANGPFGGPTLGASVTRTFAGAGQCGVPAGAKAIATNLTVVGPTNAGTVSIGPAGTPIANISAINFSAGQVRTNNAVVTLAGNGNFDVFGGLSSGSTHLVIDVLGYFQ